MNRPTVAARLLGAGLLACLALVADAAPTAADGADAAAADARWRAERLAELTSATGWLTLVGLYWLEDGANSFGRAHDNRIALDFAALAPHAGRFVVEHGAVRFEAAPGAGITHAGRPVDRIDLAADAAGEPVVLAMGSLEFFVIQRGGKFGVRVRDRASRARREFTGLDYYPFDPGWVVDARFEPYEPVHHVPIVNVLGMELDMLSPGALVFEREGREWRLDALLESPGEEQLFVMFADGTSGRETYGAGRFLYVPLPQAGRVRADFNRAHNPPCAYTAFATCPLPPVQNRIELPVRAGERRYAGGH